MRKIPNLHPIQYKRTLWEEYGESKNGGGGLQDVSKKLIYVQLSNRKLIPIIVDSNEENNLTCGWLLSEAIRKIHQHQEEFQDIVEDLSSIVALSTVKQDLSIDYYLSQFERPIKYIKDRQILTPYYADQKCKFDDGQRITLKHFDILTKIGQGGFSEVYLARRKDDGQFVALKVIQKNKIIKKRKQMYVYNEKNAMIALKDNPFIVQFYFSFQTQKKLIFVIEYCPGGELFYHLQRVNTFTEKQARLYFAQILEGIEFLHSKNIIYRDLKPENILLDRNGYVKIADFGLSTVVKTHDQLNYTFCGTFEYMAPEMIQKKGHSYAFDYYSIGVLLYEMVAGIPPFYCQNKTQLMENALKKDVKFPNHFSKNLKDLIQQLMIKDPLKRLGARGGIQEIRKHPWCHKIDQENIRQLKFEPPIQPSINMLNINKDEIEESDQIESLINECKFYDDNYLYANNFQNSNYQQVNSFNDFNRMSPPPLGKFQITIGEDSPQEQGQTEDNKHFNDNNLRNFNSSFTYEQPSYSRNNSYNNLNNLNNNLSVNINYNHFSVDSQNNSQILNGSRRHFPDDFLDFSFYGFTSNDTKHSDEEEGEFIPHKRDGGKQQIHSVLATQEEECQVVFFNNNTTVNINSNMNNNYNNNSPGKGQQIKQNACGFTSSYQSSKVSSVHQHHVINNFELSNISSSLNQQNVVSSQQIIRKLFNDTSHNNQNCQSDNVYPQRVQQSKNSDEPITMYPSYPFNSYFKELSENNLFAKLDTSDNQKKLNIKYLQQSLNQVVPSSTHDDSFEDKLTVQNQQRNQEFSIDRNNFDSYLRQNSSTQQSRQSFGPKTIFSKVETNTSLDSQNRLKQFQQNMNQINADMPIDIDENGDDISILQECNIIGPLTSNNMTNLQSIKKKIIF